MQADKHVDIHTKKCTDIQAIIEVSRPSKVQSSNEVFVSTLTPIVEVTSGWQIWYKEECDIAYFTSHVEITNE